MKTFKFQYEMQYMRLNSSVSRHNDMIITGEKLSNCYKKFIEKRAGARSATHLFNISEIIDDKETTIWRSYNGLYNFENYNDNIYQYYLKQNYINQTSKEVLSLIKLSDYIIVTGLYYPELWTTDNEYVGFISAKHLDDFSYKTNLKYQTLNTAYDAIDFPSIRFCKHMPYLKKHEAKILYYHNEWEAYDYSFVRKLFNTVVKRFNNGIIYNK